MDPNLDLSKMQIKLDNTAISKSISDAIKEQMGKMHPNFNKSAPITISSKLPVANTPATSVDTPTFEYKSNNSTSKSLRAEDPSSRGPENPFPGAKYKTNDSVPIRSFGSERWNNLDDS